MTPAQHAAYIRQLEFQLYKAEHGMGMPYSAEDVAHYRCLIAEAHRRYIYGNREQAMSTAIQARVAQEIMARVRAGLPVSAAQLAFAQKILEKKT